MDTKEIRLQYFDLGFDCIPLRPRSKTPLVAAWDKRQPVSQWNRAPADANFGLRAGNGKAFIDCDTKKDPATTGNVTRWLAGLGIQDYPIVTTPSGGAHIYVQFDYAGVLLGNSKKLASTMGTGEFRYSNGAYVAAPPSVLEDGSTYMLTAGDLTHLPRLDIHDIRALVNLQNEGEQADTDKHAPVMSAMARALANGNGVERYSSRSEAEAALMLSLLNSGFEYPAIQKIFDTMPCAGKYAELKKNKPKSAEAYLRRTYENALEQQPNESETRRRIRELQELVEAATWSRVTDKLVMQAHLKFAFQTGRFEYAASSRDLALAAGVASNRTATNATNRLIERELLKLTQSANAVFANRYTLEVDKLTHSLKLAVVGSVYVCPSIAEKGRLLDLPSIETCDAFRNGQGRLGRRAGQVYRLLFTDRLTPSEIAQRTGAHVKTIRRILSRLERVVDYKTGEIIQMVRRDETGRYASEVVDLEVIEAIFGTRGATAKQRIQYEKERYHHARDLERGLLLADN